MKLLRFRGVDGISIHLLAIVLFALLPASASQPQLANDPKAASIIGTRKFSDDVTAFLGRELAAHVADISSLDPPPDRVMGALTKGEFSWGAFMRALASYYELSGQQDIGGKSIPKIIGQVGLIESRHGGKTFAQLDAGIALLAFGADLQHNHVWQSLTPAQQQEWRSLLDPSRFYDRKTHHVINLPENYFGVAARVVAMDYKLGLITDREFVDDVIDRAAQQFVSGNLYSDDAIPTGRFDRYSNEYARYVYLAAELTGRKDVMQAMRPTLQTQMRTWWDLVSPDGYGYPWGRSLGAISYMDTMEIVAFLAAHPEFRPAPLSELASIYYAAWQWLSEDLLPDKHLLNVLGPGRGNYSYINKDREWQQTTAFFGKASTANYLFARAVKREGLDSFPTKVDLPNVARFEFFRKGPRPAGVWLVRQPGIQFALPITSATKTGMSDYLPAPYNLTNFAPPVEQLLPNVTPFLTLADGRTIVAANGADEIEPSPDGASVHATWRRWSVIGEKLGQTVEPGLVADIYWRLNGTSLERKEVLSSTSAISIRRFWVVVPSTATEVSAASQDGRVSYQFHSPVGTLLVGTTTSGPPLKAMLRATGNGTLGRGSRGPVPLLLEFEARNLTVDPKEPMSWTLTMTLKGEDKTPSAGN